MKENEDDKGGGKEVKEVKCSRSGEKRCARKGAACCVGRCLATNPGSFGGSAGYLR